MKILEKFFTERNSSQSTRINYTRSVGYYEQLTQHSIEECLQICEQEEINNIHWRNTTTRKWILAYREWCYNEYNVSTAQLYLTAIITIYRHYEYTIPPLPYYSTKHSKHSLPLDYSDLPDREILSECLQISTPLSRAIILFMSSSGISRIDTLNLTIQDYLTATKEYHNHTESIKYAIKEMLEKDVIPEFHLTRQKTGIDYTTFCSHEACKSINTYLLTRGETLTRDKPLFKIHPRYLNMIFERFNSYFQLGKLSNGYNRLHVHMLRRYHATQLASAGVSTDYINLLQGRKIKGVAHQSYIRIRTEQLKEEYIRALPYLLIEDVNKYRTESEQLREENKELKSREDKLLDVIKRIEALENQ